MGLARKTLIESFWAKVRPETGDLCWEWSGAKTHHGYGYLQRRWRGRKGFVHRAHRLSWEFHFGEIPDGLCVCHRCDNPGCVRPDHLFLGTHQDNMDDMAAKGRKVLTHGGHTYSRFTEAQIAEIQTRRRAGTRGIVDELAREFGVERRTIWRIARGDVRFARKEKA